MTQAATAKIAAEAPSIPASGATKARLNTKAVRPPVKKTIKYLPEPMLFSSVPPNTNRKSMFPNK
jgi:hypothetical protein